MEYPPEKKKSEENLEVFNALCALIPTYGDINSLFFKTIIPNSYEKRKNKWYRKLADVVSELQTKVDNLSEVIKEDQFTTLFIRASITAYKTEHVEKYEALKNVLINSVIELNVNEDMLIVFIDLVDRLTVSHLKILKFINDNPDNIIKATSYDSLFEAFTKYNQNRICERYEFNFLFKELERNGLIFISSDIKEFTGINEPILLASESENTAFPNLKINEIGLSFLKFINPQD
ncbi:TPA: hypothetical protein GJ770_03965 [Legionella pneumophila]|nr:hypothetical protein [Legionella pneumophila]